MTEQQRYQVRFDLGVAGAEAIGADADVLVWVDANGASEPAPAPWRSACRSATPNT